MRNKYRKLGSHLYCIGVIFNGYEKSNFEFTKNNKYQIVISDVEHVTIRNDNNSTTTFNINSPYGDCFCSLTYLRESKLKALK